MIDLETLGKTPGSIVVALGAVKFGPEGLGETFYSRIDAASCERLGMRMDVSTVEWWLKQEDEARQEIVKPGRPVEEVLNHYAYWMGSQNLAVWGNGATFDNVILADAYRRAGIALPWNFWNDRCYRTLKALRDDVKIERTGTHHNALDDARSQAEHAVRILWGAV